MLYAAFCFLLIVLVLMLKRKNYRLTPNKSKKLQFSSKKAVFLCVDRRGSFALTRSFIDNLGKIVYNTIVQKL